MAMTTKPLLDFLEARQEYEDAAQNFGSSLRSARYAMGMTQAAMADSAGISQSYLSQIENGSKTPETTTVVSLISVLEGTTNANDHE